MLVSWHHLTSTIKLEAHFMDLQVILLLINLVKVSFLVDFVLVVSS